MAHLGDFTIGATLDFKFSTVGTTGAPTTLAGTPVISAYVGNSTTQITAGITLTVDFDGVTGLHNVRVVASVGNGYAAATDVDMVITTGTVGGTSVVGYVVGSFSIDNRSTAAIKTDTAAILVDTGTTLDARIPAALVSGRMDVSVGAMAANVLTATAINADAITAAKVAADVTTEIQTGLATAANLAIVAGYLDTEIAAIKAKTDNLPAAPAAVSDIPTAAAVADAVWDEALAGHVAGGSTGEALGAAGGAGDPWITALPGAYSAGSAGYIVGTNLNATVLSRATQTSVDTIDDLLDTEVAAIKSDTAAILIDTAEIGVAGAGLTALASASNLATVAGYLDTEIAAIKAKTDNLPAAPAATGDIPTAVENADALLGRNVSGGSSTGRTVKQAFHFVRNKWVVAAGTLTVYDTDDTTSSWTAAVTGTAGADPVTGSDPA